MGGFLGERGEKTIQTSWKGEGVVVLRWRKRGMGHLSKK